MKNDISKDILGLLQLVELKWKIKCQQIENEKNEEIERLKKRIDWLNERVKLISTYNKRVSDAVNTCL